MTAVTRISCALALTVALFASVRAEAKPADPPAELMVSVALGQPSALKNLQAFADAIKPGTGAMMSEQVVRQQLAQVAGVPSLDGLDSSAGIYVLVIDASSGPAFAVVGKVASDKTLTASTGPDHSVLKGGWAVIGGKPQIDRVAPWALSVLPAQAAPRSPTATVFVPQVIARYKTQLTQFRTMMLAGMASSASASSTMTQFMTSYIDGLASVGSDSDQLIATLDVAADSAALDLALVPHAKSRLAAFVATQKPSDYALLDKLPAGASAMTLAGHLELGPYHDGMMAAMTMFFDPTSSKDLLAVFEQLRKVATGELAAGLDFTPGTGMQMVQLYGTTDTAAATTAIGKLMDVLKVGHTNVLGNVSTTVKADPTPQSYDGVTLRGYTTTYDLSKAPQAQRDMNNKIAPGGVQRSLAAAFDNVLMLIAAPDPIAQAKQGIDAERGKPSAARFVASKQAAAQLAAARARKDSFVALVDIGRFMALVNSQPSKPMSGPFVISFGTADHNAHMRLAIDADTLRAASKTTP
jgi:hypothetical protein